MLLEYRVGDLAFRHAACQLIRHRMDNRFHLGLLVLCPWRRLDAPLSQVDLCAKTHGLDESSWDG